MKPNLDRIKLKSIKELIEFSIINIDKPSGPTSFEIDQVIKKAFNISKTSHFGTLDPAVTGVLPVALGRACRLMPYFIGKNKKYVGIMRLHNEVNLPQLNEEIKNFIGKINQMPPKKSSVKRQLREREIFNFKILEISDNKKDILFETEVEAGTYIRKLIDDIGQKIEGAHMLELRRVKASIFNEQESHTIYQFLEAVEDYENGDESKLRKMLIPGEIITEVLPTIQVKKSSTNKLLHGSPLFKEFIDQTKNNDFEKEKNEFIAVFQEINFIGIFKLTNNQEVIATPEFVFQPLKK